MQSKIRIEDRIIGENYPCYIIAEIGINHNGNIDVAKELIKVALKAKVDAIKFQTFKAENLLSNSIMLPDNIKSLESYIEVVKKQELPYECYNELYQYTRSKGLMFIASPFDVEAADLLYSVGIDAYKIPSHNIDNLSLLKHISYFKKPIILSTGMSNMTEIHSAVDSIWKHNIGRLAILHCVSAYPPMKEQNNLRAICTLKNTFNVPIGFSDHNTGIDIAVTAAIYGASIIEKHITLDKSLEGPDHEISADPEELELLVNRIRDFEFMLGNGIKKVENCESKMLVSMRQSVVAKRNIEKGTIISKDDLVIKRPAIGIPASQFYEVVGKVAKVNIKKNDVISYWQIR